MKKILSSKIVWALLFTCIITLTMSITLSKYTFKFDLGIVGLDIKTIKYNVTVTDGGRSQAQNHEYQIEKSYPFSFDTPDTGYTISDYTVIAKNFTWHKGWYNLSLGVIEQGIVANDGEYNIPDAMFSPKIYLKAGVTYSVKQYGKILAEHSVCKNSDPTNCLTVGSANIRLRVWKLNGEYYGNVNYDSFTPTEDCYGILLVHYLEGNENVYIEGTWNTNKVDIPFVYNDYDIIPSYTAKDVNVTFSSGNPLDGVKLNIWIGGGIGSNGVLADELISYDNGTYVMNKNNSSGGLVVYEGYFTPNQKYVLEYDVQKISGDLYTLGGHITAVTDLRWWVDGVEQVGTTPNTPGNNVSNDTEVHHVKYEFIYAPGSNYNDVYIQPNRQANTYMGGKFKSSTVKISNIVLNSTVIDPIQMKAWDALGNRIPNFDRYGYTLTHWETKDGIKASSDLKVYKDMTFYPQYKANTYKLILDHNYTGAPQTELNLLYDSEFNLPTPTREGYRFLYWFIPVNGNINDAKFTILINGDLYKGQSKAYARWEAVPNIIDINGTNYYLHENKMYSDNKLTNNITSITKPTKSGYYFGGVWTEENGNGIKIVDDNGNFKNLDKIKSNITLYTYFYQPATIE